MTFSVIIETENLGMAEIDDLQSCLESIVEQTLQITNANEVILICGGFVDVEVQKSLINKFPWIRIHNVNKQINYISSKLLGADLATSEIIIFADSDVVYEKTWLESLITTFRIKPNAQLVCGYTRIRQNNSLLDQIYSMALSLTWMVHIEKMVTTASPSNHFSFNNFAIKNGLFSLVPLSQALPTYRANIVIWREMLLANSIQIYRTPGAMAYHSKPQKISDWFYRMLIFGSDPIIQSDFEIPGNGELMDKNSFAIRAWANLKFTKWHLVKLFKRSVLLIRENSGNIFLIFASLPLVLINISLFIIGGTITIFNRSYILKKITMHEQEGCEAK
ncbi:MAG: glycosyltransferase family 2 protein [Cyclobacteriaceae bacterium]